MGKERRASPIRKSKLVSINSDFYLSPRIVRSVILTINALVFDYRDIVGDRLNGTKTIPAFLGHRRTRGLLMLLAGAVVFLSLALSWLRLARPLMPVVLSLGCAVLLRSLQWRMHPTILSALADTLLFLPAVGELLR